MSSESHNPTPDARPARFWFREWIGEHKARIPHALFRQYEEPGDLVYQGWLLAFEERAITRAEATEASKRLQAEIPIDATLPSLHLPQILAIVAAMRAGRRQANRAPSRPDQDAIERAEAEELRSREAWASIAEPDREHFRRLVIERCSWLSGRPALVERLARTCWLERVVPVPGHTPILDAWQLDPVPDRAARPIVAAASPAALTAEEERFAVEQATTSRQQQLGRLRAASS